MKYLFIIVGDKPQAGKTTTGKHIAAKLSIPHISTSDTIYGRVEKRLGLAAGTIVAARVKDPNNYRKELIVEGDKMQEEKYPPGIACLDIINGKGGVIEGIRREKELADTCAAAVKRDYKVCVLAITRAGNGAEPDNTEQGIMNHVDYVILNNCDVQALLYKADAIVENVLRGAYLMAEE